MSLKNWWRDTISPNLMAAFAVDDGPDESLPILYLIESCHIDSQSARLLYKKIPIVNVDAIIHCLSSEADRNDAEQTVTSLYGSDLATGVNPYRLAYYMVRALFEAGHQEVALVAPQFSEADRQVLDPTHVLRYSDTIP
jgi:hypothetical protein